MKRFFIFMVGLGIVNAVLFLAGSPVSGQSPGPTEEAKLYELAKKEGTIVWYGSTPLEAMRELATDFEKKYPGIKVEALRIVGVAGYQRFLQETNAKQYIADVLNIADYPSVKSLASEGHIVAWRVPTSDRILPSFRIGDYSYSPALADSCLVYNYKKVTPEEVKILRSGWKGVLDPRFKGRFAVTSMKGGTQYAAVHMFLDPKYAKVFGPDFIKAIAAQEPTVYSEVLVILDRVVAGEHDFGFFLWEQGCYLKWMQGAPVRWLHPDPTPLYGNSWYAVSKYAPHPNGARLFLNWLMSEEGALSHQRIGYPASLQGVKDIRKAADQPWYDPPKTRYDVDWERWGRDFNKDMDFWIKTIMRK